MTTSTDVAFDAGHPRALRRSRRRLRRQRAARPGRGHRRRARQGGDGPRARRQAPTATAPSFVDVQYFDMHVKRARILDAEEETLDYVPPWYGERLLELGRQRCARIGLSGPRHARAARRPRSRAAPAATSCPSSARRASSSTSARPTGRSCPTRRRAGRARCIPELSREDALAAPRPSRSCTSAASTRTTPSPPGSERARPPRRHRRARDRPALRRAALRRPGHRPDRRAAADVEVHGGEASRPSTASSTCPTCPRRRSSARPTRSAPTASCARPSRWSSAASIIKGLEVEFRDGKAVRIDADEGADVLRGYAARDEGASRLGEVALVDGDGRIGKLEHRRSSTRCSTRTPRRTSRWARATRFTAGEEDHPPPQPLLDPHRLHDRRRRRGRHRHHRRRRASRPSCATAPGSSSGALDRPWAARLSRAWRGAGAVERARLEIA